ncbi:DUF1614 domain-containing protein [Spiribacter vilamensis]|uniref:Putative membrane protein n=1 Tax=Spiribacter vilamensis TaxID=531306 RepID=A0A4V2GJ68_9GAMM|nr:DUF1614 domain-containing protein [Spiribacter vilamensis]RZU99125.1 putative membrane protein [Spiribacter vilamensis]TVO61879.1 DUF1614 domain-containing protein [Spiribacter vilamensis]
MPLQILAAIFLATLLFVFVQIGVVTIAFDKLGLSQGSAMLLLITSLVGSGINLPLFTVDATREPDPRWAERMRWMAAMARKLDPKKVLIAVNVGGGIIPVAFSVYLLNHNPLAPLTVLAAIAIQTGVCYGFSRPISGVGIGMPIFIAPISAAITAVTLAPENSAPLAYIGGTLGVLLGADALRLRDVRGLGSPLASIGGAGTFDGVFITGLVAVLLA